MTADDVEGKQSFPQPSISEKKWSKELERDVYEKWKKDGTYAFNPKAAGNVYSIDTPPPYLNTPIHIGHATTYSLMDMFARYKRMKGFNVLFPLGLDNNGLPIEMAAEKKFGIRFHQMSREEFLQKCRQVLEEAGTASIDSFLKLGIGFNSWKRGNGIGEVYETDSADYRMLTQETFIDLWNKGLIYEEERINNYCPGCRTTIADAEIDYTDVNSIWNDVAFTVKETKERIIIGTTRPELISSCIAVIFNPEDERYRKLEGKTALTPIYNSEVKIMAHPQASMEKGTGLVMMCTAGDTADIRFAREVGLASIISINLDGTMNENAGFLNGMKIKDARKAMVDEMQKTGLLLKQTPTVHRTPVCDRSGDHVEFIQMKEFYVKQLDYKEQMLKIAKEVTFYDESSRQMLTDWINSVSIDWPISRRRYYATEIPLWHCRKCNAVIVAPKGRYCQPWREPAPVEKCGKCGSREFEGETRVLDTWFDSSNSPLYILKYNRDDAFFRKSFPCTLRPQGKDIVRTWLYYTLLKGYLLTGKSVFAEAWINYYIVDEHGKKMSKRKGNVVDPHDILEKYGAEPFRLWAAIEGNITTTDFRCSFERIDGAGKAIAKLWNVARFVSMFEKPRGNAKLQPLDEWIRHEVNDLVEEAAKGYDHYDFHNPSQKAKHFLWETFASHYVELAKNRAYNSNGKFSKEEQAAAVETLHYCIERLLLILAPIIPMITFKLYYELYARDVHFEKFPSAEDYALLGFTGSELEALDSEIWKRKKEKGLSLKAEVKEATLPEKFKPIEKDMLAAHNIAKLSYGKELRIVLSD